MPGLNQGTSEMKFQPAVSGWLVGPLTRRFRVFLPIAFAVVLLGSGCRRQAGPSAGITLTHEITPHAVRVGPASITLNLKDAAAQPLTGAHITLEGDMTHPGMEPVFGEANEISPGRYQGHLEFGMGGDWVVLVHATLQNGQHLERQIEVKGVEGK